MCQAQCGVYGDKQASVALATENSSLETKCHSPLGARMRLLCLVPLTVCSDLWGIPPTTPFYTSLSPFLCKKSRSLLCLSLAQPGSSWKMSKAITVK